MTITTLTAADEERIADVCALLVQSFADLSPGWVPTMDAARRIVAEAHEPGMLSRILVIDDRVAGWVGARHDYGFVWELHPLVVDRAMRGRGYGRALVEDIEELVADEGALTLLLGTSDEAGLTTLSGRDLFGDPLGCLRDLEAAATHPVGFWRRIGYTVVGVIPDAEGAGKPTILLAKPMNRPARATARRG